MRTLLNPLSPRLGGFSMALVYDLVIQDALLATAGDVTRTDIAVKDGRVVCLALPRSIPESAAAAVIDAAGRYVTPGGVDAHVHLAQPSDSGAVCADGFASGTRSAVCGGTTTVIPFATQLRSQESLEEVVAQYHATADAEGAHCDYAFHVIITNPTRRVLDAEIPKLAGEGYTSFKLYMTYETQKLSDKQILDILLVARREGCMTMIHAENGEIIEWLTSLLEDARLTAPHHHVTSRPQPVEREATHRAITLSQLMDTPILLVHVSAPEAIEQIRWARAKGLQVHAETCPQYLFLTSGDLIRPGFEGAKLVCSPPPRESAADQEAVWQGLRDGTFAILSSDHAPSRYADPKGKMMGCCGGSHGGDGIVGDESGHTVRFRDIPNGVPGIETRLPLLFSEGVLGGVSGKPGRLDIRRFVDLTSTTPARLYGLYPRKGTIAPGSDADIVIWDTVETTVDAEVRVAGGWVIANDKLHHDVDYTPYEGRRVRAWPKTTIVRGVVVWRDGRLVDGVETHGRFLPCERPEFARSRDVHVNGFDYSAAAAIGIANKQQVEQ